MCHPTGGTRRPSGSLNRPRSRTSGLRPGGRARTQLSAHSPDPDMVIRFRPIPAPFLLKWFVTRRLAAGVDARAGQSTEEGRLRRRGGRRRGCRCRRPHVQRVEGDQAGADLAGDVRRARVSRKMRRSGWGRHRRRGTAAGPRGPRTPMALAMRGTQASPRTVCGRPRRRRRPRGGSFADCCRSRPKIRRSSAMPMVMKVLITRLEGFEESPSDLAVGGVDEKALGRSQAKVSGSASSSVIVHRRSRSEAPGPLPLAPPRGRRRSLSPAVLLPTPRSQGCAIPKRIPESTVASAARGVIPTGGSRRRPGRRRLRWRRGRRRRRSWPILRAAACSVLFPSPSTAASILAISEARPPWLPYGPGRAGAGMRGQHSDRLAGRFGHPFDQPVGGGGDVLLVPAASSGTGCRPSRQTGDHDHAPARPQRVYRRRAPSTLARPGAVHPDPPP